MLLSGRTLLYKVFCCAACANELVDPPDLAMTSFVSIVADQQLISGCFAQVSYLNPP